MKKPSKQQLEKQLKWLRQYIEVGSVEEMLKIKKLDLSHKGIKGEVDLYMPALERLDISDNQLTSFTGEYPALEWLYLSNNQLTSFAGKYPALERLDISDNQLTSFTGEYPALEWLYFSNNQLTSFTVIS